MVPAERNKTLAAFLSQGELTELERIRADKSVIGFALFDADGEVMEVSGIDDTLIAVFSNILDMSRRVGEELGESRPTPAVLMENRQVEAHVLVLSSVNMLVLRRKSSGIEEALRHVR